MQIQAPYPIVSVPHITGHMLVIHKQGEVVVMLITSIVISLNDFLDLCFVLSLLFRLYLNAEQYLRWRRECLKCYVYAF